MVAAGKAEDFDGRRIAKNGVVYGTLKPGPDLVDQLPNAYEEITIVPRKVHDEMRAGGSGSSDSGGPRSTYLRVTLGTLESPSGSLSRDGAALVQQIVGSARDEEPFPARLYLLLVTPSFQPYEDLLQAVHANLREMGLGEVPVIGASVAVCCFDHGCHERGAMLLGFASRFMAVRVAVGLGAQDDPVGAVTGMLEHLGLCGGFPSQPRGNRFVLTFLPGYGADGDPRWYRAPEIFTELRNQLHGRIHTFGGVASGGLQPGMGAQFAEGQVFARAAVVALVDTDVTYGMGLNHGLGPALRSIHVKEVSDHEHVISALWGEKSPEELMKELGPTDLFCMETPYGDRVVAQPKQTGSVISVPRRIPAGATLHIVRPHPGKTQQSVTRVHDWIGRSLSQPSTRVGALLIGCVARYRERHRLGFDIPEALDLVEQQFSGTVRVGCYMDGEIGIDHFGRPVFGNWSLTELTLADDMCPSFKLRLASEAIRKHTGEAATAPSLDAAIGEVLKCVATAGYQGAMVSMVLQDDDSKQWIVAQEALGGRWQKVLPLTRREFGGEDILAEVARSQEAQYVMDATTNPHCDHEAARAGNVISFYVLPLLEHRHRSRDGSGTDEQRTLGILQIDLGDLRGLPVLSAEQQSALNALGAWASAMINRAVQTEELTPLRTLDLACVEAREKCCTFEEAASHVVVAVAKAMGAGCHIRLLDPETNKLRLIDGGWGSFYDAGQRHLREIDVHDSDAPSALSFRNNRRVLINELWPRDRTSPVQVLSDRLASSEFTTALREIGSLAILPIVRPGGSPVGVVAIDFAGGWSFTQHRLALLNDIGTRLSDLIAHVHQKKAERFLRDIKPAIGGGFHLYAALRHHAERARQAASARVTSFFLWDDMQKRFVLRAEAGWADKRWLNAAFYELGEGMTGTLAMDREPHYIDDLRVFKRDRGQTTLLKYGAEMFGFTLGDDYTCEVITLPLWFAQGPCPLAIVTNHRLRKLPIEGHEPGFATADREHLRKVAADLSAYVYGLRNSDRDLWEIGDLRRRDAVMRALLEVENEPEDVLLDAFTRKVIEEYQLRHCAIYMPDSELPLLRRVAYSKRPGCHDADRPLTVDSPDDLLWHAFRSKRIVEKRRPPTDRWHPTAVRADYIVERVCLPVVVGGQVVAAIDQHWRGRQPCGDRDPLPLHDEEKLLELANALASVIDRRRGQTQRAVQQANRALNGVAAHLAKTAHEQAKLVTSIKAWLNICLRKSRETDESEELKRAIDDVGRLIDLFRKARDSGQHLATVRRGECALDALLNEVVASHASDLERQRIDVVRTLDRAKAWVHGGQILECFENVVDNAIRSMPQGGRLELVIRYRAQLNRCEILVADTGSGISAADVERILRGEQPLDTVVRTGMGLFLSRLYCESHGGQLEIDSCPSEGTRVRITLPIREVEVLSPLRPARPTCLS
ncbi:MAG: hypothetical protein HYS13_17750 [Planctomycetia bacterium]|nr:hypothetical protein [Planctomycetia bacterium]